MRLMRDSMSLAYSFISPLEETELLEDVTLVLSDWLRREGSEPVVPIRLMKPDKPNSRVLQLGVCLLQLLFVLDVASDQRARLCRRIRESKPALVGGVAGLDDDLFDRKIRPEDHVDPVVFVRSVLGA